MVLAELVEQLATSKVFLLSLGFNLVDISPQHVSILECIIHWSHSVITTATTTITRNHSLSLSVPLCEGCLLGCMDLREVTIL